MTDQIDLHIGQRLRHRRWLQGMTQLQLAEAVGIRFQQIQKYESGANRVSASRIWDLAQALNVPVSFFYAGFGDATHSLQTGELSDGALEQKETMDLVRAYYAIKEGPRRMLFELAQAASKSQSLSSAPTEILPFPRSQTAA
jgi:transcriptional regulator with XRE-family HTH domain